MFRFLAIALIQAAALWCAYRTSYLPYRFNLAKPDIERHSLRAFEDRNQQLAALQARRNLEVLAKYETACDDDVDLYMEKAANERVLGRMQEAIASYENALEIDHRPEIYFNLGATQLQAGDRERGIENLVTAVRFHPEAGYITDPAINAEVHRRVNLLRGVR